VAGLDLLNDQLADEVVFGLFGSLVDKVGEVLEKFTILELAKRSFSAVCFVISIGISYRLAEEASRAVALPLVRMAFCSVRNFRSWNGTPRMV